MKSLKTGQHNRILPLSEQSVKTILQYSKYIFVRDIVELGEV